MTALSATAFSVLVWGALALVVLLFGYEVVTVAREKELGESR